MEDARYGGLTQKEVKERINAGKTNQSDASTGLTVKQIILSNTLTYFNLIFLVITVLLCGDVATKIGMGLAASSLVATSLSQLEREEAIDGNSVLNTLQQFSGALSTTVVSVIFGWAQKTMSNGSMVGSRISIVLILAITLIALGLVLKLKFEARN